MNKKIKFIPKLLDTEFIVDRPKPSKNFIPKWFKDTPAFLDKKIKISSAGVNSTFKLCTPFSDSFNMGYIQETWCDIFIERQGDGGISYFYSTNPQIMGHREFSHYPIPQEYYPIEFAWRVNWVPQLPDGYSLIYTHPLNRIDLPFYSLTGVVDSDKFKYEKDGNHPFFIKKDFEGLIPAGTPMYQMIPFKRDDWTSEFESYSVKNEILGHEVNKNFWGRYRKKYWSKKNFE